MKKVIVSATLFLLSAIGLYAQQNQVQRNVTTVILTGTPSGDCRYQFYQVAIDASQNTWTCNTGTGAWVETAFGSSTGTGSVVLSSGPTITAPVISSVSNTGTVTLPSTTGGVPVVIACGATTGATATCGDTAVGATAKVYFGAATLASNASVITISPGFTSSTSYFCVGNDVTTRANPVQVVPTSATTFTITNTTGATDVIQYICTGY